MRQLACLLAVAALLGCSSAQVINPATQDIQLAVQSPSCTPMNVAYNPGQDLWYSTAGGSSSCPIWTHDGGSGATVLRTAPGNHDWRGIWWNGNLDQLEANPCSTCPSRGIRIVDLNGSGHALGTGSNAFGTNQPNFQSQGDYDWDDNEIIYYDNGRIYRVDRATNQSLPAVVLNGIPGGSGVLNRYMVGYTGVPGHEYLVWDYNVERALFFDKATGNYVTESRVPGVSTSSSWNVGYANGRICVYSGGSWRCFQVNEAAGGPAVPSASATSLILLTVVVMGAMVTLGRFTR